MKKRVFGLLGVALLLVAAPMRGAQSAIDRDLLKVQREIWESWFAGDTARVRELTPGLIGINAGGGEWDDQESAVRSSAEFHANGGRLLQLEFPRLEIQRFGEVSVIYSTYRYVTVTGADTVTRAGRATEVFFKRRGSWVNSGWHMDSGL